MRRASARSVVVALAVSSASCSGRNSNADSAVQADRAAATVDTSGGGAASETAPLATPTTGRPPATPTGGRLPATGASNATSVRPSATADTLRGIVKVVGSAVNEQAVLRPNGGGAMVALTGPEAQALQKVASQWRVHLLIYARGRIR